MPCISPRHLETNGEHLATNRWRRDRGIGGRNQAQDESGAPTLLFPRSHLFCFLAAGAGEGDDAAGAGEGDDAAAAIASHACINWGPLVYY